MSLKGSVFTNFKEETFLPILGKERVFLSPQHSQEIGFEPVFYPQLGSWITAVNIPTLGIGVN